MPGATAWLDAPLINSNSSIEQWRRPMVVTVTKYTLFVTSRYDVIFTCANTFWWSLMTQHAYKGAGAVGTVKELRAVESYKKQKIVAKYVCFCSSTMLTSKIITEITENFSELSGDPNSCIYLFQVDLDKPWNYLWYCCDKAPPPRCIPFGRVEGAMLLPCLHSPAPLCMLFYTHSLYSLL